MDLTTLAMFLALFVSAVSLDTVLHPTSIVLNASVAGKFDKLIVDADALSGMLTYEVTQICSTPSLLAAPEVRPPGSLGVGLSMAQAVNLQPLAIALQTQFGYQPEEIKLTLLGEDGAIKLLVSGAGLDGRVRTPPFQELLVLQSGESVAALVHRAALSGMTRIDPYITSLYLVRSHTGDGDFSQAEALINQILAQLPPTPISSERSLFENLLGIIAVHRGRLDDAKTLFHQAAAYDPDNAAAELNTDFVDMQTGDYRDAAGHVEMLMRNHPPSNKTLLAAAYMTWGAALLAQGELRQADRNLAKAVEINPLSSATYDLWSDLKQVQGDKEAADRLHAKALEMSSTFENYTAVAALYFRVAWKPGQPLTRNPYGNPGTICFN